MASRNIHNILKEAQKLSTEEYQELLIRLKKKKPFKKNRSILELEGLGKELWEKVDVEKYIEKEIQVIILKDYSS